MNLPSANVIPDKLINAKVYMDCLLYTSDAADE